MANTALTGNEIVYVQGQDLAGHPAAIQYPVTTCALAGAGSEVSTAQVNRVSSTVLTTITGLTAALQAGGKYIFRVHITGVSTVNCGAKFAIGTSDTLTATSFTCTGENYNGTTTNARSTTTTLGAAVGAATAVFGDAFLEGAIVVNAAGTLTVQIAQNVSHADTCSAFVNSDLMLFRVA
jgi:hypothetical protein